MNTTTPAMSTQDMLAISPGQNEVEVSPWILVQDELYTAADYFNRQQFGYSSAPLHGIESNIYPQQQPLGDTEQEKDSLYHVSTQQLSSVGSSPLSDFYQFGADDCSSASFSHANIYDQNTSFTAGEDDLNVSDENSAQPTTASDHHNDNQKHRPKSSSERTSASSGISLMPPTRSNRNSRLHNPSHSAAERRYRDNLNRQIQLLRDSLPNGATELEEMGPDAAGCSKSFTKASVVSRAVTYIRELEAVQARLYAESQMMAREVAGLRRLVPRPEYANSQLQLSKPPS